MMEIEFWLDYCCPYSYIGLVNLKEAIMRMGLYKKAHITVHSLLLYPNIMDTPTTDTLTRISSKYGLSASVAREKISKIEDMAFGSGITMDYLNTQNSSTFDAHRLARYVRNNLTTSINDIDEKIFAAYFADNKVLSSRDTLLDIARECGLDESEVATMLNDKSNFANDIYDDASVAKEYGIIGTPYITINDEYIIRGAMWISDYQDILANILNGDEGREFVGKWSSMEGHK